MTATDKDFVIVNDESAPEQTMSGHGTVVRHRRGLDKNFVEKQVSPTGVFKDKPWVWSDKISQARAVADRVRALNNPAYDVPKTFLLHNKVYETVAPGVMWGDLSREYLVQNKDWLIPAAANLINDMSEMKPVRKRNGASRKNVPGVIVADVNELSALLNRRPDVISRADANLIKMLYKYLLSLPECNEMVYGHNDLNGGNVFIDDKTRRVTIIDFEMAGYNSKMLVKYRGATAIKELFDYIDNNLARKLNVDFKWNFDENVHQMYALVWWVVFYLKKEREPEIQKIPSKCARMRQLIKDKKLKFNIAAAATYQSPYDDALVPMSHYER